MERKTALLPGEFYHVYSRGVDKRVIFVDDDDRRHFLMLLYLCNSTERISLRNLPPGKSAYAEKRPETLVDIGMYCLMTNHIHLLLYEKKEGGISTFMAKLLTAYAKYFNTKVGRTGALFDGRFRAKHVSEEGHMHYLYAYIHLNPIKIFEPKWKETGVTDTRKAEKFLNNYMASSYQDFAGIKRKELAILSCDNFPDYIKSPLDFKKLIREWMNYREDY